jgi:hypothetical protein
MMEAERMAHLILQIGAAIIVPVGPRRRTVRAGDWRKRALREAAMDQGQATAWPAAHVPAGRIHGLKIGRALSSARETV